MPWASSALTQPPGCVALLVASHLILLRLMPQCLPVTKTVLQRQCTKKCKLVGPPAAAGSTTTAGTAVDLSVLPLPVVTAAPTDANTTMVTLKLESGSSAQSPVSDDAIAATASPAVFESTGTELVTEEDMSEDSTGMISAEDISKYITELVSEENMSEDSTEMVSEEGMSEDSASAPNRKLLGLPAVKAAAAGKIVAGGKIVAAGKVVAAKVAVKNAAVTKKTAFARAKLIKVPLAAKAAVAVAKGAVAVPMAAAKAAKVAFPLAAKAVVSSAALAHAAVAKEVLDVAHEAAGYLPKVVRTTVLVVQTQ